jgi:hypothetical protein
MADTASQPSHEQLMELAERFLDDEGQVKVSVLLDDKELRRAQIMLLGAIDKSMNEGELDAAEAPQVLAVLGLSLRDIERLRGDNAHLW